MAEIQHLRDADLVALFYRRKTAPPQLELCLVHLAGCLRCRQYFLATHGARAQQCLIDFFGPQATSLWREQDQEGCDGQNVEGIRSAYSLLKEVERNSLAHVSLVATNRRSAKSLLGSVTLMEEARRQWNANPALAESLIDATEKNLRTLLGKQPLAAASQLCRCLAFRANSLRIRGALRAAEATIDEASRWYESTLKSPSLGKELLLYRGLIQREQRKLALAIDSLTTALEPPGPSGGYTMHIEARITLAHTYAEAEKPEKAISILEEVLSTHSRAELGDFLYFAAMQSLAINSAEAGYTRAARDMLPALESTLDRFAQGDLLRFRLTWLEAKICEAEGNRAGAASFFRETIQACRTFDLPYDAALAALELAHLHLESEDTGAAKKLAEELIPIFKAREIHREATAAGLVLARALRDEEATAKHVREVMDVVFHGKAQSKQQVDSPTTESDPETVES